MLALMLSGSAYTDPEPTSLDLLYATPWSLLILNSEGLQMDQFPDKKPDMQFTSDGKFSANVGCNQISGGFTLTAPDIMVFEPNMISTKMACSEFLMKLEDEFTQTLPKVKYWKIENGKALTLSNANQLTVAILTNVTLN